MSEQLRPPTKIAFFAGGNPLDIQLWSGTPYYALRALQREGEIVYIEERPYPRFWHSFAQLVIRLTAGRIDLRVIRPLVWLLTLRSRGRLIRSGAEVFVSVAASAMASMLPSHVRQVLVSDATSKVLLDYYGNTSTLRPSFRRQFIEMETEAMNKAEYLLYPSRWARDSAVRDFGIATKKAMLVPWGPNMEKPEGVVPRRISGGPFRLLFVGVAWERKGGPMALETARILRSRGINCHLDIVGVDRSVVRGELPGNVTFHGRLRKSVGEQRETLNDLFRSAHLFFLPTNAEALGMVFAEASAMAIPSLSYATGGVSTVVRDGETGILLNPGSSARDFADIIAQLAADPERYAQMSQAALRDSIERLDWSVWARELLQLINN